MINDAVGVRSGSVIDVSYGRAGHALYGPYVGVDPGEYIAEFLLEPLEDGGADSICALVDVACDTGRTVVARAAVFASQIELRHRYELPFSLNRRVEDLELRVFVNGTARVRITDPCAYRPAQDGELVASPPPDLPFFKQHRRDIETFFSRGFKISAVGDELIFEHSKVVLHGRSFDDVRFLDEIFLSRVYSLAPFGPSVLIDVGMNVGLTSLLLAQNPLFEEIYAFEPFAPTYQRALANLALNPGVAGKIRTFNLGLSDRDETRSGFFHKDDSGQSSTSIAGDGDNALAVTVRDAAKALEPIFTRAQRSGRRVVMKIDCEGAEFALFRSLIRSGLIDRVTAMMVEWHREYGGKEDLLRPLSEHRFVVIDHDPQGGNGFFYAVRAA